MLRNKQVGIKTLTKTPKNRKDKDQNVEQGSKHLLNLNGANGVAHNSMEAPFREEDFDVNQVLDPRPPEPHSWNTSVAKTSTTE